MYHKNEILTKWIDYKGYVQKKIGAKIDKSCFSELCCSANIYRLRNQRFNYALFSGEVLALKNELENLEGWNDGYTYTLFSRATYTDGAERKAFPIHEKYEKRASVYALGSS